MEPSKPESFSFSGWDEISPAMFEKKDYLTEVFLRSSLEPFLEYLIKTSEKTKETFSIVFMDLDRFKQINDKYGHLFGDDVLRYVGSSLRLSFREIPCRIFRYGGDEFIIVFPGKTSGEAYQLVQMLKYTLAHRPILFKNKLFKIYASYGIASYPSDATTVERLLKEADNALYFSKHQGRNSVILSHEVEWRSIFNKIVVGGLFLISLLATWMIKDPATVFFKKSIDNISQFSEQIKMKDFDKIVLRDGLVIYGEIAQETNQALTIVYQEKGETIHLYLEKTMIREKVYGKKTQSENRFKEFLKWNPNPHF